MISILKDAKKNVLKTEKIRKCGEKIPNIGKNIVNIVNQKKKHGETSFRKNREVNTPLSATIRDCILFPPQMSIPAT